LIESSSIREDKTTEGCKTQCQVFKTEETLP
jgi:hypothetical protein